MSLFRDIGKRPDGTAKEKCESPGVMAACPDIAGQQVEIVYAQANLSLVVALVANPLILSRFMKRTTRLGHIVKPEDDLRHLKKIYVGAVSWALNHRFRVICMITASLAVVAALMAFKLVKVEIHIGIPGK